MAKSLSKKQKRLKRELDEIFARTGLDYWSVAELEPEARTSVLEVIRRDVIRGEVVSQYTLLDEHLGSKIAQYFYPRKKFVKLWNTRSFQRFNFYILERMPLMQKVALVKDIYRVPKSIGETIQAVNALRNALAHAFFPENLRDYQTKGRPAPRKRIRVTFKGVDIFTIEGIDRFLDDMSDVSEFFIWKIRRKKDKSKPKTLIDPTVSLDGEGTSTTGSGE